MIRAILFYFLVISFSLTSLILKYNLGLRLYKKHDLHEIETNDYANRLDFLLELKLASSLRRESLSVVRYFNQERGFMKPYFFNSIVENFFFG